MSESKPPTALMSIIYWMKNNLFSSVTNILLTVISLGIILSFLPGLLSWLIFDAVWTGDREACSIHTDGACWIFIFTKIDFFIYGFYPQDQHWRVNILYFILFIGILWLVVEKTKYKIHVGIFMIFIYPIISFFMIYGNETLGLPIVETNKWGGLMLTLIVSSVGIVFSLPFGILLALGRRAQKMKFIQSVCIIFIEFWRGVPLITVLFMAAYMLPLFLPSNFTVDNLLRALLGVAFFSSAYMAEVVRGGLQGLDKGQYEASDALGLNYFQKLRLVILPQALKIVIPGIVNTFIGLFKDTTLVSIIALFDLLGAIQSSLSDPNWSFYAVPYTSYAFTAIVFFVFCFAMAKYSKKIESKLDTGHKK